MLPGSNVGQGETLARSMPPPSASKEESLGSRLSEIDSFVGQCHGIIDGCLAAVGFPPREASSKRPEPMGLAGRVMDIRSDVMGLRDKLELLKNALE